MPIILSVMRTSSISNKSVYDLVSQQVLYEFFAEIIVCSFIVIVISYIELQTCSRGHVVVGVVEVDVPLFFPNCAL